MPSPQEGQYCLYGKMKCSYCPSPLSVLYLCQKYACIPAFFHFCFCGYFFYFGGEEFSLFNLYFILPHCDLIKKNLFAVKCSSIFHLFSSIWFTHQMRNIELLISSSCACHKFISHIVPCSIEDIILLNSMSGSFWNIEFF
jgi:hypothetical protein